MNEQSLPKDFFWRKIHSLTGILLFVFLFEHLFTNAQAALIEDGKGFVKMVDWIHDIPFLPFIEVFILGLCFSVHIILGIFYLKDAVHNVWKNRGQRPSLGHLVNNWAYTWQRVTAWILLFAIFIHVVDMRILRYPKSANLDGKESYMQVLKLDPGLYSLAGRLHVELYDAQKIAALKEELKEPSSHEILWPQKTFYNPQEEKNILEKQQKAEYANWLHTLKSHQLQEGQVLALSQSFGKMNLLMVRDSFKEPLYLFAYSLFVLAAAFHACNGMWTACIVWGITLSKGSQAFSRKISNAFFLLFSFLGLAAIWGSYWLNLNH